MKRSHFLYTLFYLLMVIFAVGRVGFMLYNHDISAFSFWDICTSWWNGALQDMIVSAALLAIPGLLTVLGVKRLRAWLSPYYIIMSVLVWLIIVADIVMYEFWQFKLSAVVLAYAAHPEGATGSVSTSFLVSRVGSGLLAMVVTALVAIFVTPKNHPGQIQTEEGETVFRRNWVTPLFFLIGFAFLFVNSSVGRTYYSSRLFMNHSAVNPVYEFVNSCHLLPYENRYDALSEEEREDAFNGLYDVKGETTDSLLKTKTPDVLLIFMESFGSEFIESMGGAKGADPNIERLIPEGIFWENYYSNSFRTDRATVSTQCGWTAYADLGLMDHPEFHAALPSLAKSLGNAGYDTSYLYLGSSSNMGKGTFLKNIGYQHLLDDTAFPKIKLETAWGAYDMTSAKEVEKFFSVKTEQPRFYTYHTISSHEPWDVPYQRMEDKVLNAFAYTDAAVGQLVDSLKNSPSWDNLLVIIIPDHGHLYHQSFEDPNFFHAPMLWLGGAIREPRRMDVLMNQSDIAATLLAQMGLSHDDFPWSRDVLSSGYTYPFVFCVAPSVMLYKDSSGETLYDISAHRYIMDRNAGGKAIYGPYSYTNEASKKRLQRAESILQTSYDQLENLKK